METKTVELNRLGTEKIGKLLLKMSVPMMISMLVLALYNIVDTLFVAKISEEATSALTIAFPFQMLISSIAVGTSVGISSLISRRLGEQNQQAADNAATVGVLLLVISGALVSLIYFFLAKTILQPFSTDEVELNHAVDYLRICGSMSLFVMISVGTEKIIQGTGNAVKPMIIQLAGAITNIVFDPILIFGYGFFPKMGVAGAAVATVAGQAVSMVLGLLFLLCDKKKKVTLNFREISLRGTVVRDIYDVGAPSILMQSIASFVTMGIYAIINAFLVAALKAKCVLGIYFKIQSFIFMPVFGLNSGSLPIMAYNYGARRKDRFIATLKLSLLWALIIMLTGLALFQIFPKQILSMFESVGKDPETLAIGVRALRTISLCFPFAAVGIILVGSFNAVGKGIFALIVSGARQVVVILPAAFILAKFFDAPAQSATYIWWAYPIAELMGLVLSITLFLVVKKRYLDKLNNTDSVELK
ncbi:MAG: MATE family efflux transporter [Clostridia bacterium]|nr:MATE family efflux transporter [Clostridia bacterium]